MLNKRFKNKEKYKTAKYIVSIAFFTLILSIFMGFAIYHYSKNIHYAILGFYLSIIPGSEIVIQLIQYILSKFTKARLIPKMNMYNGIDKQNATFVVIPTIVKNSKKVKELFRKLEVYYLANKSDNLYFAILGDASESDKQKEDFDLEVISAGIMEANRLNEKYKHSKFSDDSRELVTEDNQGESSRNNSNKFYFLYRKRVWNESQGKYLGWERKRGLLCEFNKFLTERNNGTFEANTLTSIPKIKYVITLDADTRLPLNSGLELVGAMVHPLNKPELSKNGEVVVKGHALIQPRVGIDILSSRKSLFTKIFAGSSGTDLYSQAISDVYQDNFNEGIFTGKGIYDLEIFDKIFKKKIPENVVLSHDLLEGSFLRCGLATDIMLIDGFPYKYNAYMRKES